MGIGIAWMEFYVMNRGDYRCLLEKGKSEIKPDIVFSKKMDDVRLPPSDNIYGFAQKPGIPKVAMARPAGGERL